jgi:superfamily II DNA or RNA helicase
MQQYSDDLTTINLLPDSKLFRISYDNNVGKLKIICKTNQLLEDLRNCFSDNNPASFFVKQYGYQVDNKVYAINKFGYFESGLVFDVLNWIKINFGSLDVLVISKNCKNYLDTFVTPLRTFLLSQEQNSLKVFNIAEDCGRNNELKRLNKKPFEFRDYQKIAIEQLLFKGYGRGLIEIPTGGGKSFIIANFIWTIHKLYDSKLRYMILVPNKQLVEQFYSDLLDYGFEKIYLTKFTAGLKKSEKYNPLAKIIIANRQYVFKNFDKLPDIDVLICDEVHTLTADVSKNLVNKINSPIKIGCSGTIPRENYKKWSLIGMFSRIIYEKDITELQNNGYISKLKITLLQVIDKNVEDNKELLFNLHSVNKYTPDEFGYSQIAFNDAYNAEIEYFNTHYKELYTPILNNIKDLSGNSLILFDRIEFGSNMFELAKILLPNKNIFYIDGNIDVKIREDIRLKIEETTDCIIFGQSSCVSTGLNFKRLHNIIFFFSGKSFSRVIQSIGRTLRLSVDKQFANLIDISFNFKYSVKHLKERLKIYKDMYNKSKPDNIIKLTI